MSYPSGLLAACPGWLRELDAFATAKEVLISA
jgi:hypothetical protein